jgi:hypothetical protein
MCDAKVDEEGSHLSTTVTSCVYSYSYRTFVAAFLVGGPSRKPKRTEVPSKIVIRICQKMA